MWRLMAGWVLGVVFVIAGAGGVRGAEPARVILLTESKGWDHEVVKPREGKQSRVDEVFDKLAGETKLFTVEKTRDAGTITPEKLKGMKLIVFYTTGELPMSEEQFKAFDQWIK